MRLYDFEYFTTATSVYSKMRILMFHEMVKTFVKVDLSNCTQIYLKELWLFTQIWYFICTFRFFQTEP